MALPLIGQITGGETLKMPGSPALQKGTATPGMVLTPPIPAQLTGGTLTKLTSQRPLHQPTRLTSQPAGVCRAVRGGTQRASLGSVHSDGADQPLRPSGKRLEEGEGTRSCPSCPHRAGGLAPAPLGNAGWSLDLQAVPTEQGGRRALRQRSWAGHGQ